MKRLRLPHALFWIVASMLGTCALFPLLLKGCRSFQTTAEKKDTRKDTRQDTHVRSIVQTGPQKEALKTEYLAEVLGISADRPPEASALDIKKLRARLLASPLISRATVCILKPNLLYIDYTVRQPIAYLADAENVALDREGIPFPFAPFFSPKNLPAIYLGLTPFGKNQALFPWGSSLKGQHLDLAFDILASLTEDLHVTWIDTSQAFSESFGKREIVLGVEDPLYLEPEETKIFPRLLRLSPADYAKQLGNYLALRKTLLEEEREALGPDAPRRAPVRVVDLRIPNLAFVDELHKESL
jgi:hypothetical protein